MTKRRLIKVATEAHLHASEYAFAGRKQRKRNFRQLWIVRISEAVKQQGMRYSVFIKKLKDANIQLDRKMLAHLIVESPKTFQAIVEKLR